MARYFQLPKPDIRQERESGNSAGKNHPEHVVTHSLSQLQIGPIPTMAPPKTTQTQEAKIRSVDIYFRQKLKQ